MFIELEMFVFFFKFLFPILITEISNNDKTVT